jgi:hypothetical protein
VCKTSEGSPEVKPSAGTHGNLSLREDLEVDLKVVEVPEVDSKREDSKREDLIDLKCQSWVVDQEASSQITRSTVTLHCGVGRCARFKISRTGRNRTMVFGKGRVAVHGELRGQKRFSFKPPLVAPAIAQLCRVMALGHIEDGARERSCAKGRKRLY